MTHRSELATTFEAALRSSARRASPIRHFDDYYSVLELATPALVERLQQLAVNRY